MRDRRSCFIRFSGINLSERGIAGANLRLGGWVTSTSGDFIDNEEERGLNIRLYFSRGGVGTRGLFACSFVR